MKFFLFLISVFFSAVAISDPNSVGTYLVPIDSTRKLSHNVGRGTGVLFRHQNEIYALTSDHVIIHDNTEVTHQVYLGMPPEGRFAAELVASDWSLGLALLRLKDTPLEPFSARLNVLPGLEFFSAAPEPTQEQNVKVRGIPFGLVSPILDTGLLEQKRLEKGPLFKVPSMLRVSGSHNEFGMSGGFLLDAQDRFLGLLSHQQKLIRPQNPQEFEFDLQSIPEEERALDVQLLVIPNAIVSQWLQETFSDGRLDGQIPGSLNQGSRFFLPDRRSPESLPSVESGEINFTFLSGDGSVHLSHANPIVVDGRPTHFSRLFLPVSHPGYLALSGWESFVRQASRPTAKVLGFRRRVANCPLLECWRGLGRVRNLREFFLAMENAELEPVVLKFQANDTVIERLHPLGVELAEEFKMYRNTRLRLLDLAIPHLSTMIRNPELDSAGVGNWQAIKPQDIELLLNDSAFQKAWEELQGYDSARTQRVRRLLREIQKVFEELVL